MVIAVVGMCGVGKSEVAGILHREFDFEIIYFGGVILEEVRHRGLPKSQASEKAVREQLRREAGPAAVAMRAKPKILEALERSHVVIDGLYTMPEYRSLAEELDQQIRLLAIHADREVRYERMANRPERPLSPDDVDKRDRAELAIGKAKPVAIAHFHLLNNSHVGDLTKSLRNLMERCLANR